MISANQQILFLGGVFVQFCHNFLQLSCSYNSLCPLIDVFPLFLLVYFSVSLLFIFMDSLSMIQGLILSNKSGLYQGEGGVCRELEEVLRATAIGDWEAYSGRSMVLGVSGSLSVDCIVMYCIIEINFLYFF